MLWTKKARTMDPSTRFSSLRKCRFQFKLAMLRYPKLQKKLNPDLVKQFDQLLEELDQALRIKNLAIAQQKAMALDLFLHEYGRKSFWDHSKEFVVALVIALAVAGVVRQVWFELYEIPTGSMRPTFKECDRVFALKDTFGINTPFQTSHLYFDPKLVKRGSIIVLTGDGLALPDVDTTYFLLFPGKKRYVKRCVAKPGDTIYFYGGQLWGIDSENRPFGPATESSYLTDREYIPFMTFEGRYPLQVETKTNGKYVVFLRQMNLPLARISISRTQQISSEVMTPSGWAKETFTKSSSYPQAYMQFWGIHNFATCQLKFPEELPKEALHWNYARNDARLYLELTHSPTLPTNDAYVKNNTSLPLVITKTSWVALNELQCDAIKKALYTARFYMRSGRAIRYSQEGPPTNINQGVLLNKDIPDGCYEFYNGKAYSIDFASIASELPPTHPLYPHTLKQLQLLYNCGIDFFYSIAAPENTLVNRSRYTYFRDETLFLMGSPIVFKNSPELHTFTQSEIIRAKEDTSYIPFLDEGAPVNSDGSLDVNKIAHFGLHVPEKSYIALGDNHAMSLDSRYFGFLPEKNIQGSPAFILWPPGNRWGPPPQPSYPFLRLPQVIVLTVAAVVGGIVYVAYTDRTSGRGFRRRQKKRIMKKERKQ